MIFEMERNLERVMDQLISKPGVSGCLFADHYGLCLGAKGKALSQNTGLITSIAEQVAKLEPNSPAPVIYLENESHSCTIHRVGTITGAIFKEVKNE